MIGNEDAERCGTALASIFDELPIAQVRALVEKLANEWKRAAAMADDEEVGIEFAASVVPGMRVPDFEDGWREVRRSFAQNGAWSLHLDAERNPAGTYLNFASPVSPVVVVIR